MILGMKNSWFARFTLCLVLGLCNGLAIAQALQPAADGTAQPPLDHARATALLDALDAGQWAQAHAMLASAAAAALPPAKLEQVWQGLELQMGKRTARSAARAEAVGSTQLSTFRLDFPTLALDARVHVDAAGNIDGFRIVPAATEATPTVAPSPDSGLQEDDRTVAGLGARLTRPKSDQAVPAVVLVHGSGPSDMDGTLGPNKPLRDIAHGLAARGIAVLRYSKRTHARPQDFTATSTLDDEVVDDALAAVALLRGEAGVDPERIILLGHSLGGQLAPRIAARSDTLAGLVLLAAPARRVHHMVAPQVRYIAGLDGTIDENETRAITELEAQRDAIDSMLAGGAEPDSLMLGASAAYWRDLAGYDAVTTARPLPQPMLILQGGRDYQVTVEDDFRLWQTLAEGRTKVTTRIFPELNHLFMRGQGASTPQEYLQPGRVDEAVIDAIADWIGAL